LTKKPRDPRKIPVDKSILSDDDRAAIRKEAQASIVAEMEQDARDAYFAQQLKELRRARIPAERMVKVTMSLAPFLPHLLIDHDQYFDGYTYDVEQSRAAVLYEQMQRSWAHQDEIDGRSRFNAYRRPRGDRIGPQHEGTPTRGANGIVTLEN
jgi:hypothetical protein